MKNKMLILAALLLALTSFQPFNTNNLHDFVGVWTLRKFVGIQKDGKLDYPYGENPAGQILYDADGNMMVEIMRPGVKNFTSANFLQGTPEEMSSAYGAFLAYYGTYEVVPDSGFVVHHIKVSSFPNWVNQDQKRYYEFKDNQLILTTPVIGPEKYEVTWEKTK